MPGSSQNSLASTPTHSAKDLKSTSESKDKSSNKKQVSNQNSEHSESKSNKSSKSGKAAATPSRNMVKDAVDMFTPTNEASSAKAANKFEGKINLRLQEALNEATRTPPLEVNASTLNNCISNPQ